MMGRFCVLISVLITQVYAFAETHKVVHLRFVHFTIWKFHPESILNYKEGNKDSEQH